MTKQISPKFAALAAALALLAGCAAVGPNDDVLTVPKTQSVAEADDKLARVARERAQAEAEFAAREQFCYTKFMVNNCLDKARENRRVILAGLRAIEIEAAYFKRKAAVEQRDRELAEGEKKYQAEEARLAAEPPAPAREVPAAPKPSKPAVVKDRAASNAARLKQIEAEEQAGAAKRAANVAAFEKRKRESEERQRKVEEKKKKKAAAGEGEAN